MTKPLRHSGRNSFVRRLESVATFTLSGDERIALLDLPMQVVQYEANQDIVRAGDRPSRCFTLLDGFVSVYKTTMSGKRQVVAIHVPGDVPDIQSLHLKVLDSNISTIGPCEIAFVQHDAKRALLRANPRLSDVFWRATLIDAAISREWVLNNGRREAYNRMAHLFCEMMVRLGAVGLASDRTCWLPMTQTELADVLGLTAVHVNRTLRDLKAAGLITLHGRNLIVDDWERLKRVAEFDPAYLHLSVDTV